MLLQAAWILALPPFRGIDEFDHVYRAAAVNEGQWRLSEQALDGRGLVAVVPRDIVDAATRQCAALEYTGRDNCYPIAEAGPGLVQIATAAGAYNPAYYAVIGLAARPFAGADSAYAMRIFSALLCAVGVALAALALAWAGAGVWTRVGLLVALTPVFVYSTVVPAPNGFEMVAGLCLWAALLTLGSGGTDTVKSRHLIWMVTLAAGLLATLRTLGPIWLGLIVGTVAFFIGGRQVIQLLKARRGSWMLASVFVLVALAFGAAWTWSAGLTEQSSDLDARLDDVNLTLGVQPMVWALQIVAAFPLRGEPAAPAVYIIYLLVFSSILAAAIGLARGRSRWVLVTAALVVLLLPLALTFATYRTQGVIWQGRYQLAYAVGLPLMAGVVLDRWASTRSPKRRLATLAVSLLGVAHVWSVVGVFQGELDNATSAGDPSWIQPSTWLLALLLVGGIYLLWRAVLIEVEPPACSSTPYRPDPRSPRTGPQDELPRRGLSRPDATW
jgi:hypothetical protein